MRKKLAAIVLAAIGSVSALLLAPPASADGYLDNGTYDEYLNIADENGYSPGEIDEDGSSPGDMGDAGWMVDVTAYVG